MNGEKKAGDGLNTDWMLKAASGEVLFIRQAFKIDPCALGSDNNGFFKVKEIITKFFNGPRLNMQIGIQHKYSVCFRQVNADVPGAADTGVKAVVTEFVDARMGVKPFEYFTTIKYANDFTVNIVQIIKQCVDIVPAVW